MQMSQTVPGKLYFPVWSLWGLSGGDWALLVESFTQVWYSDSAFRCAHRCPDVFYTVKSCDHTMRTVMCV